MSERSANPAGRGPPSRDLVVVGASAGGVESLRTLIAELPADLPAAVLVVLHVPANGGSALSHVLSRVSALPVRPAVQGQPLTAGTVTVAVPDRHLLVGGAQLVLSRGPQENGHRPAVDPLFRSAAQQAGPRTIAVVLSGSLDDGAAGALAVQQHGGVVLVQDPDDALYDGMPRAALQATRTARVGTAPELGRLVVALVRGETGDTDAGGTDAGGTAARAPSGAAAGASGFLGTDDREPGSALVTIVGGRPPDPDRPGEPAGFTCPDCAGPLFSVPEHSVQRYRCRIGHAWTAQSLAAQQTSAVEGALWMAVRSLEERADLAATMGARAWERGHTLTAGRFTAQATEARASAAVLRDLLQGMTIPHHDAERSQADE